MIEEILTDCQDYKNINNFRDNHSRIVDYLKRHRKEYPVKLDNGLLELIQKCEYDWSDFFLLEYLSNPSQDNALRLGIRICREDYCDSPFLAGAFKQLEEKKMLNGFLAITLPPDLPQLPPPISPRMPRRSNQYTDESFNGLPRREEALQFVVHSGIINTYLQKKQKLKSEQR